MARTTEQPRRTVLITGASRGIGLGTAHHLAAGGYEVIGWSRSEPSDFPGTWMRCDLSDPAAVEEALGEVLAEHTVDCLVNNAALPSVDRFSEIPLQQLMDSLDFHARTCLQMMQGVIPGMKERGWGRIVNILTTTLSGYTQRTCYRAGKEAVKSLTISAALELAEFGITVNGVAPGPVATAAYYTANPPGSPGETYWLGLVPMQRFGTENEIAAAVGFFLSEGASFVTGQQLFVDGGMSVGTVIDL